MQRQLKEHNTSPLLPSMLVPLNLIFPLNRLIILCRSATEQSKKLLRSHQLLPTESSVAGSGQTMTATVSESVSTDETIIPSYRKPILVPGTLDSNRFPLLDRWV